MILQGSGVHMGALPGLNFSQEWRLSFGKVLIHRGKAECCG